MRPHKMLGKNAFAICMLFFLFAGMTLFAEERKFYFGEDSKDGFVKVTPDLVYGEKSCWGYDLRTRPAGNNPFFFSVDLPEGSYRVTLLLGNEYHATHTTIRSESRRLMLQNIETAAGEFITRSFTVHIRNMRIDTTQSVRIKPREVGKLNWDDKLTLEINGMNPGVREMTICSVEVPTIFLAGNSTVTDQDHEPWCGWGQMLPRFLNEGVVVANYAESGEAGNTFISAGRFAKILTQMKEGDYLFIEFGHNDQKQKGPDRGPYTSYKQSLKQMIEGTRAKGAKPVLVTPMHRRRFDETGKIINTLGDYPDAVRQLAAEENVLLIDLNEMSKTLYEAWGPEISKKAFVHYPAGTFPGQHEALEDNTHFNTFGGDQICKCILRGIQESDSPLKEFIVTEFDTFDPAHSDKADDFYIPPTPFYTLTKPEGN